MASARRLFYEGVIYRFKFLMLATLLCAAMTVIGFILGQVSEGKWKWDEDIDLEYTSAFFTGVYGMWNVYILALLCLYSPSHKRWPSENGDNFHFHPIISLLNRILLECTHCRRHWGNQRRNWIRSAAHRTQRIVCAHCHCEENGHRLVAWTNPCRFSR